MQTDHAAQRGRDAFGTATRISASLSRRLFAFFGSTLDQAPKAAKYAVLIPGPGMFVNVRNVPRVVIAPNPKRPPVSACEPLCAIFLREPSVCPLSLVKANVGRLCEKLNFWMRKAVRLKHKIKRGARNWAPLSHKAPRCGAFRGFETAV